MKLIATFFAVIALAGCATLEQAVPPTPKTPQQTVFEVKAALVSAEDAGLAFAKQVCPTPGTCQDGKVKAVVAAIITADTLVNAAEQAVRADTADSTAAQKAAVSAQAALKALRDILTQYGITVAATGV